MFKYNFFRKGHRIKKLHGFANKKSILDKKECFFAKIKQKFIKISKYEQNGRFQFYSN